MTGFSIYPSNQSPHSVVNQGSFLTQTHNVLNILYQSIWVSFFFLDLRANSVFSVLYRRVVLGTSWLVESLLELTFPSLTLFKLELSDVAFRWIMGYSGYLFESLSDSNPKVTSKVYFILFSVILSMNFFCLILRVSLFYLALIGLKLLF